MKRWALLVLLGMMGLPSMSDIFMPTNNEPRAFEGPVSTNCTGRHGGCAFLVE